MKRIMPLRDYSEHDVVNFFALDTANTAIGDSGNGDAGVIVKITNGDIGRDAAQYVSSSYLGKTDYPFVGRNGYPEVPLKVGVAGSGEAALGITLYETAMYDENGEKLLYYRQKANENQVALTGQAVPVLTKGTMMFSDKAFHGGSIPAPMASLTVGPSGKFMSVPDAVTGVGGITVQNPIVGKILATGMRVAGATADYFVGSAGSTGTYAMVRFDFN